MKIGILAAGITPDALLSEFGSYADMVVRLFDSAGCHFEFEKFDVRDDEFPCSATACDGWVITGSRANVYQNLPWMVRLKQLILEIDRAQRPLVGICFGHQIIAEAFGGRVEKYSGGWGVGLQSYRLLEASGYPDPGAQQFTINAIHQDQVVEKPKSARRLASSEFCQNAVLAYGERMLTLQSHPEFTIDFEQALLRSISGVSVPPAAAEQGLASLRAADASSDSLLVARWMSAFLQLQGTAPGQALADSAAEGVAETVDEGGKQNAAGGR